MTSVISLLVCASATQALHAQGIPAPEYQRAELSIPMRDGTRLFAVALAPRHVTGRLPIILIRTPFEADREFRTAEVPAAYRELAEDGYIFVTEDIRGRYKSGGVFITSRPQAAAGNVAATDESTDAYDTIDWLVKNIPANNGRVGTLGVSYRGWLAALAGVRPHPALKAISPQAPMADLWMGDDFFHQGAFRQTQGVEYAAYVEGKGDLVISDGDHYAYYLRLGTLGAVAAATGIAELASWIGFRTHPSYDAYWKVRALQNVFTSSEVPTLFVGGFWDEEDILGPQLAYHTVERADRRGQNSIVLGPWSHGAWARTAGASLGALTFGSNTSEYFRQNIQRPWLAYYLKGSGAGAFPEAWAFESGENAWHTFDAWPPRTATPRALYLRAGGKLSFDAPAGGTHGAVSGTASTPDFDLFLSDPAHPVPNTPRPDDGNGAATWLVRDQRFVDGRPDVLTWQSEPLAADLVIAGDVVAHLFASTTGTDADWVVKLIDVYPDSVPAAPEMSGYQLIVNADIMRGRYWKNFEHAAPIPANVVTPFTVDMHEQLYRFVKGHRLMVQVQSSWFPLYDRNPQRFIPNIFDAAPSGFRAQFHRIWHTLRYPSNIALPVLP